MINVDDFYKMNSKKIKDWQEPIVIFLKKSKQYKLSYLELMKSNFIGEEYVNHLSNQLENEKLLTKWLSSVKFKGEDKKKYPLIMNLDELHILETEISNLYMLLQNNERPKNCEKAIDTFCTDYPFKLSFDEFYINQIF